MSVIITVSNNLLIVTKMYGDTGGINVLNLFPYTGWRVMYVATKQQLDNYVTLMLGCYDVWCYDHASNSTFPWVSHRQKTAFNKPIIIPGYLT